MNKHTNNPKVIFLALIVFVLGIVFIRMKMRARQTPETAPVMTVKDEYVTRPGSRQKLVMFRSLVDEANKLKFVRDPFLREQVEVYEDIPLERTDGEIELEGIIWDDVSPQIIMNGEVLSLGSTIEGRTIIDIKKDRVTLIKDDSSLKPEDRIVTLIFNVSDNQQTTKEGHAEKTSAGEINE